MFSFLREVFQLLLRFSYIGPATNNGLRRVKDRKTGRTYFVDVHFEPAHGSKTFAAATDFNNEDGVATVYDDNGRWSWLTSTGATVYPYW